jgi:hypothetical protein
MSNNNNLMHDLEDWLDQHRQVEEAQAERFNFSCEITPTACNFMVKDGDAVMFSVPIDKGDKFLDLDRRDDLMTAIVNYLPERKHEYQSAGPRRRIWLDEQTITRLELQIRTIVPVLPPTW